MGGGEPSLYDAFYRVSFEAAYIEKSAITAVKPRPEFYNLIYRSGGPDGGRVRMTDKALIVTWLHPHYQHQTAYAQVSLA